MKKIESVRKLLIFILALIIIVIMAIAYFLLLTFGSSSGFFPVTEENMPWMIFGMSPFMGLAVMVFNVLSDIANRKKISVIDALIYGAGLFLLCAILAGLLELLMKLNLF